MAMATNADHGDIKCIYHHCVAKLTLTTLHVCTDADDLLSAFEGPPPAKNGFQGSRAPPSYEEAKKLQTFPEILSGTVHTHTVLCLVSWLFLGTQFLIVH